MILQPVGTTCSRSSAQAGVAARVQAILVGLRAAAPRAPGYAGGNLLNLLLQAGIDCRGLRLLPAQRVASRSAGRRGRRRELWRSRSDRLHLYADHVPACRHVWPGRPAAGRRFDMTMTCVCGAAAHGQLQLAFRTPGQGANPLVFSPDGQFLAGGVPGPYRSSLVGRHGRDAADPRGTYGSGRCRWPLATMRSSWPAAVLTTPFASGMSRAGGACATLRHPRCAIADWPFARRPTTDAQRAHAPAGERRGRAGDLVCGILERGQVVDVLRGHAREIECLAFSRRRERSWPVGAMMARFCCGTCMIPGAVACSARCGATAILSATSCFIPTVSCWRVGVRIAPSASGMCSAASRDSCSSAVAVRSPSLAFDPDGRVLASVSVDRVVRLWEVRDRAGAGFAHRLHVGGAGGALSS